jgi:hypothetical protein
MVNPVMASKFAVDRIRVLFFFTSRSHTKIFLLLLGKSQDQDLSQEQSMTKTEEDMEESACVTAYLKTLSIHLASLTKKQ